MPPRHALYTAPMLTFSLCVAKMVCDKGASSFRGTLADLESTSAMAGSAKGDKGTTYARAVHALAHLLPQHAAPTAPGLRHEPGTTHRPWALLRRILSFTYRHMPPSTTGSLASGVGHGGMISGNHPRRGGQRPEADVGLHGRERGQSQLTLLGLPPSQPYGDGPHQGGALQRGNWAPPADAPDQFVLFDLQLDTW